MKKILSILLLTLFSSAAYSQENMFTLAGGYVTANMEDGDLDNAGWRINLLYEFNPQAGSFAHGFSFGYLNTSSEETEGVNVLNYKISSWPIYYAPKFLFGSENFKGFIKGAIGMQFSLLERTGTLGTLSANDHGFTGGAGAGVTYFFDAKVFVSAEYELLWMVNSYYSDGLLNTVGVGFGYRF